jgi:pimeloyl-ACP methyl ester carboxylesterase
VNIPPVCGDLVIRADGESLAVTLTHSAIRPALGTVLALHGAGDAVRQRSAYLADHFAQRRLNTIAFDMSGHGESSGALRDSSLRRRHDQATAVACSPGLPRPDILLGNSMGGYVASSLLPDLAVRGLILICPALYASDAHEVPFDESFTAVLRRPGSFRDSRILEEVREFRGAVLVLIGDRDEVIPREIVELYLGACTNAAYVQHSVIPGAPHRIHLWAAESEKNRAAVTREIDRFLDNVPVR